MYARCTTKKRLEYHRIAFVFDLQDPLVNQRFETYILFGHYVNRLLAHIDVSSHHHDVSRSWHKQPHYEAFWPFAYEIAYYGTT